MQRDEFLSVLRFFEDATACRYRSSNIFICLLVTVHCFGCKWDQLYTQNRFAFICFRFLSCFPLLCCEGPFLPTCPSVLSHCPVLLTYAQCSHLAVLSLTSWPYFHVLAVLSILACIYRPVPTYMSLPSCPTVLSLSSWPCCPNPTIPTLLS